MPPTSALLVMDVLTGVVGNYGGDDDLVARLHGAAEAARAAGLPVVFVRIAFRPSHPEVSGRNQTFAAIESVGGFLGEDSDATQIHPALERRADEPVVTKRRVSAFTGSDLEVLLRSLDVDHLVLCGIATSGVVLSTLLEAADRDYELTVLADGCADPDDELHGVLIEKVFPQKAAVTSVSEWSGRVARS